MLPCGKIAIETVERHERFRINKCPNCDRPTLTGDKCVTCLYATGVAAEWKLAENG